MNRPRKHDTRTERLRIFLGWIVATAAAAALYMSWGALHELALAAGIPDNRAWVFPIIIDLPVVAAMLIGIIVEPTTRGRGTLPWIVFGVFTAATIAGNAERVRAIPTPDLHVEPWIAALVHATPPIAVLLLTHLAAVTVYRPGHTRPADRPARPAEPTPSRTTTTPVVRLVQPTTDRTAQRDEVLALAAQTDPALSRSQISVRTGVAKTTVNRWIADAQREDVA